MKIETREEAHKWGLIEAAPVVKHVNLWLSRQAAHVGKTKASEGQVLVQAMSPSKQLAAAVGIHEDTIYKYTQGNRKWMDFDVADKLITWLDPFLWHCDPDLSEIFQAFDFTRIDLSRPTTPDADGVLTRLASGESQASIARSFGVHDTIIARSIRNRKAMLAA